MTRKDYEKIASSLNQCFRDITDNDLHNMSPTETLWFVVESLSKTLHEDNPRFRHSIFAEKVLTG
jgi:hypothetical protein